MTIPRLALVGVVAASQLAAGCCWHRPLFPRLHYWHHAGVGAPVGGPVVAAPAAAPVLAAPVGHPVGLGGGDPGCCGGSPGMPAGIPVSYGPGGGMPVGHAMPAGPGSPGGVFTGPPVTVMPPVVEKVDKK